MCMWCEFACVYAHVHMLVCAHMCVYAHTRVCDVHVPLLTFTTSPLFLLFHFLAPRVQDPHTHI